jgi:ribosome-associated protein
VAAVVLRENGDLVVGSIVIRADEIELTASTSGGPGGQHANRTLSRITASFSPANSLAFSEAQRLRLASALPGVIRVSVATHRSQAKNRNEALERLGEKIEVALRVPKRRRPTKATKASAQRRLESKRIVSGHKARRAKPRADD